MSYDGEQAVLSGEGGRASSPRLLDQVRARMRLRHYSLRTEQAYLYWIHRHIRLQLKHDQNQLDGVME